MSNIYTEDLARWYLAELASADPETVTGDVFEVIGESDCSIDVSIITLADSVLDILHRQTLLIQKLQDMAPDLDAAKALVFSAYSTPGDRYPDDRAWSYDLLKKATKAHSLLQGVAIPAEESANANTIRTGQ